MMMMMMMIDDDLLKHANLKKCGDEVA